jgi:hypothetical protein
MTEGLERQATVPHLKRLFMGRAILEMERSVQFNLCPLATACITENAPSATTTKRFEAVQ